jgi:Ca2+-binding EF-hand superfamily protein
MKLVKMVLLLAGFCFAFSGIALAQNQAKPAKVTKTAQKCEASFKAMDKDSKGYITLDEFMGGCKHCGKAKREASFKAKDANSDGKLTLDEYCAKKSKAKAKVKDKAM